MLYSWVVNQLVYITSKIFIRVIILFLLTDFTKAFIFSLEVDVKLWSVVQNLLFNDTDSNISLSLNSIELSPAYPYCVLNKILSIPLLVILLVILVKSNNVLPSFNNLDPPNLSVYAGDINETHFILVQNSGSSKHFNNIAPPWLVEIATTLESGGNDFTLSNIYLYLSSAESGVLPVKPL